MNHLFWGAMVRICEALTNAAPTILVGILVAAYFRSVLGGDETLRLFGGTTWRQIPRAWGMGMLLPVCSLGAIPIMTELRRFGLVGGTILAFGLTAPIFNPVSVLYGLSLSHPLVIITICLCSLVIVTSLGWSWDRIFPNEFLSPEPEPVYPHGVRRIAGLFIAMFRISASRDMAWIAIGILGVGLLSALLPPNSLQRSAEHGDYGAPFRMAVIALPAYVTPMDAMVQLSGMFQHGNSIAAAFTLLILGTGLNIGVMVWSVVVYGWKKTIVWLGVIFALVIALGFVIERPLYPEGITPEGHTHAYDQFCAPFDASEATPAVTARRLIFESTQAYEGLSLAILAVFVIGGFYLAVLDPASKTEQRLARVVEGGKGTPAWDITLPRWAINWIGLGALVICSMIGCYLYYPPPDSIYAELAAANAEVCSRSQSGDTVGTLHWIPVFEDLLKKLEVSMRLRFRQFSQEELSILIELESCLEELEHAMNDSDPITAQRWAEEVRVKYFQFRGLRPPRNVEETASW